MTAQRKNIKNDIETLDRILWLFKYKKDAFIGASSGSEYDKTIDYVKGIMDKLKDERQKLPIGYRYTGTFYLKKPYTIPSKAVKIKGSIFMREDLVSWVVESEEGYAKTLGYVRDTYKDTALTKKFSKDDAVAVFEDKGKKY